ncbi:hypothetical protein TKK_0019074 [Trichogramma kaykai]
MPFGLHSAPAVFQRLMDSIITLELEPNVFCYLDDIVIISETYDKHRSLLEEVFRRLKAAKLKPNWEKSKFGRERLKYLGHVIDKNGINTDPDKVKAITDMPTPKNLRDLRRFTGLISCETSILQTDTSNDGLGAVLTQNIDGKERVIASSSRTLNKAEKNYSATEKEYLAVKWGIWKMRDYLEGYHFVVITDHQSLQWLSKIDNPSGRLARWAIELNQWDFEVKYRKGTENTVADVLSRSPLEICAVDVLDNWYSATFEKTEKSPDENPEYCISDGKLYKNILHT